LSIRNRSFAEDVVEEEEPMWSCAYIASSMRLTLPIPQGASLAAVRELGTGDFERAEGQMVRTCCSAAAGGVEIEL
jgi:hypothetical protein